MADTTIASFLNKLEHILLAEVDLLQEVENQLWSLHSMLTRLTFFLMEVGRKQSQDFMEHRKKAMEKFVMEVITLVYEAEDVLDSYLNTIREVNYCGLFMDEARKFISQIKGMMESLKELHAWLHRFTESNTSGTSSSSKRSPPPIEDGNDDAVVVLEDEVKRMIDLLKDKDQDGRRDIVPVVGSAGMGKTTLVRKVYNDSTIVEHFPCRSWIYVSNDYKVKELLHEILKQIMKPTTTFVAADNNYYDEERKEMSPKDLAIQIYKHLKNPTCRYLVVFDDVCKTRFWADINKVFPNNKCGSRLIFTTRHDEVAFHVRPSRPPFYLRRLSKEESWALFSKRFISQLEPSHHHQHPWQELVDACGGLPLKIIALAAECHRHLPSMRDDEKDDESGSDKILPLGICELIYNALPHHLKMCLAYCDVLKEGYPFFEYKALMVAEGLVKQPPPSSVFQSQNQTSSSSSSSAVVELEDIAEEYLNELINMNLIKVQNWGFDGGIKKITIPREYYTLLDLCSFEVANSKMNLKVRSLFESSEKTLRDLERILQDFVSLRVLDLRYEVSYGDPCRINLIHLRYLQLHFRNVAPVEFTIYLSDLWNLRYLKIISRIKDWKSYAELQYWKMPKLRHFSWPGFLLDPFRRKEVNSDRRMTLKNLQTLEGGLDDEFSVEDVFSMMPNLLALRLHGETSRFDDRLARSFPLLKCLQKLKLVGESATITPSCKLEIFPPNITHLSLGKTYLQHGYLVQALRMLQNLRVLKLKWGSIDEGDFVLDFGSDVNGFRQLKFLKLDHLNFIKWWILSVGVMPSLQKLSVRSCYKLEGLPSAALEAIPTLQELEVDRFNDEVLVRDARLIEERVGKDRLKLNIFHYW